MEIEGNSGEPLGLYFESIYFLFISKLFFANTVGFCTGSVQKVAIALQQATQVMLSVVPLDWRPRGMDVDAPWGRQHFQAGE